MYLLQALLQVDSMWCSRALLAAKYILPLEKHPYIAKKLALFRLFSATACLTELTGLFLLLYGAFSSNHVLFVLGIGLKIASHLWAGILHNCSGTSLNLFFQGQLNILNRYQREFSGLLNQKGLTDAEIRGIPLLSNDLYLTEINAYPYQHYLHILTPLISSAVLTIHGQLMLAALITSIGLISLPLGSWFYQRFSFRQKREQRFAETAQQDEYTIAIYNSHIRLTFFVNLVSQLPLALFTFVFVAGINTSGFGSYLAITMGLSGLIGMLGFQKTRASSQQTVDKAIHLLNVISCSEFLITHSQWKEHIKQYSSTTYNKELENGVILSNFFPSAFSSAKFRPLNISIPAGSVYLFQAPSGSGKSMLILALLHLVQHRGDFAIVRDSRVNNIHSYDPQQISKSIIFVRQEDLPASARLTDIFADVLQKHLAWLEKKMRASHGDLLTDLAFKGSDNLLEIEIEYLEKGQKSIFPKAMLSQLLQLRQEKDQCLRIILNNGYCYDVSPERILCTLSDGEKRRVVNTLTVERAFLCKDVDLVILDEPLAHLDEQNVKNQLFSISRLQNSTKVCLFIISHHHIDTIFNTLQNVHSEELDLPQVCLNA